MGQALYRTYRSRSLAEMVGQEHITEALAAAIKSGRISHAYLFTGPRGVGKTSAARILAHEINGLPYDGSQHLDIIEIDAASNRRIDDIRDLRDKVHIAPTSAKYKVYIIDEVHMLTGESFNALLKTLEEPPEHVVFILATTEIHKLPATIISRTQRFNFRLAEPAKVIAHLKSIAQKEKIEVDDAALALIAEHGEGSFRDSINVLDQLANVTGGKVTAETVERSLGLAPKKAIEDLLGSLLKHNFEDVNKKLTELEGNGTSTGSLVPQLTRYLQGIASQHPQLYSLMDALIEVPRSYNPRLKLRTTLTKFAIAEGSNAPSTSEKPQHKPAPVAAAKPILRVETAPPPAKKPAATSSDEPQKAEGQPLAELTPQDWSGVLARVKADSAPLFGVLRQAQPIFDAERQTLTLRFKYTLHRKKIDSGAAKKSLAAIMLEVLHGAPIIQTELDPTAAAPELSPAEPPQPTQPAADDVTASVIQMMGGGEIVNA